VEIPAGHGGGLRHWVMIARRVGARKAGGSTGLAMAMATSAFFR
jgi:hypothetical protein